MVEKVKMVGTLTLQELTKLIQELANCKEPQVKLVTEGGGVGGCFAQGVLEIYCNGELVAKVVAENPVYYY